MSFQFLDNYSLSSMNTFAVNACAAHYFEFNQLADLAENIANIQAFAKRLVLGGGSNVLFAGDYDGLVIHPNLKGVAVIEESHSDVLVSASAQEVWHDFVVDMTERGYYGLENLALIPGSVGASPVQNIGAYGTEIDSVIEKVEVFDLESGELKCFSNTECEFAYRDSCFKRAGQGKYLVTKVFFRLTKTPNINIEYRPLAEKFKDNKTPSPLQVLNAVCEIRQAKLPDPAVIANAGSFFKNPTVSNDKYQQLRIEFPNIVAFPVQTGMKLAAGWLIDHAGLKGYREENIGIHKHQALVLVNYGEKDGAKILRLAQQVQAIVSEKYGVDLEVEVRVEGGDG